MSDGSADAASAVGEQLECSRKRLSDKFASQRKQPDPPVSVIAFRDASEMRQVAPLWKGDSVQLGGLFLEGESGRFIAVDLSALNLKHIVAHEFGHSLLNATSRNLPVWLQEGLAELIATVANKESEYLPSDSLAMEMATTQLLSLETNSPGYNEPAFHGTFYTQAALAAKYLWVNEEQRKQLLIYLELKSKGTPAETAIRQAFQTSDEELNTAVLTFAMNGQNENSNAQLCTAASAEIIPISDIDARARIAEVESLTTDHREHAIHEFEAILGHHPKQEIALRGLVYALWQNGDATRAKRYFPLAVDANPLDWKLRYLSAVMLNMGAHDDAENRKQMRTSLLKVISLQPEFADAHHWLSLNYAWDGDYLAAASAGLRAVELDPDNEQFKYNLAAFYAHARHWSDARRICEALRDARDKDIASQAEILFNKIERADGSTSE